MNLNESQKKAVTSPLGTTLVIAGPGSGKTHVIINRINYMIQELQCDPRHILVVTFSKLAAEEMKERYLSIYGSSPVTFGTLHSIFYRILRRTDPKRYALESLILEDKKKIILQNLLKELDAEEGDDFLEGFMKHLSLMQNQLILPNIYYPEGISRDVFLALLKKYESYKERHHLFDFDDMLVDCYYLLKNDEAILKAVRNQYRYLLIDEFQDINLVQFEIIKIIASGNEQLFVVGDDDQSIYQFRGAKPSFLLDFDKHFNDVNKIFLNVNYRSTKQILDHSLALIAMNENRFEKCLSTPNPLGEPPLFLHCKDAKEEAIDIVNRISKQKAEGIALSDMAVIYRTNLQARPIIETLLAANIPFCLRDGMISLYDQWITQDILSYLYLADNINQPELAKRIINKPKRYISQIALQTASQMDGHLFMNLLGLDTLTEWQKNYIQQLLFDLQVIKEKKLADAIKYIRHNIGYDQYVQDYAAYRRMQPTSLFDVLDDIEDSASSFENYLEWEAKLKEMAAKIKEQMRQKQRAYDVLTLTTMHGAKGLEYNTVFIIDAVDGTIPHHKSQSPLELEEERRLFYVGMTRAKKNLFIYIPNEKHNKEVCPSPFINDIQLNYSRDKLQINCKIYHKSLGEGIIIKDFGKGILQVQFKNGQVRKIDSHYCIKNAIITLGG